MFESWSGVTRAWTSGNDAQAPSARAAANAATDFMKGTIMVGTPEWAWSPHYDLRAWQRRFRGGADRFERNRSGRRHAPVALHFEIREGRGPADHEQPGERLDAGGEAQSAHPVHRPAAERSIGLGGGIEKTPRGMRPGPPQAS